MSKKVENPVAEEEWEDVEEGEEEEEEDTTINNSDVVTKYKKAAIYANEALAALLKRLAPNEKVAELCKFTDDTINELCQKTFKGLPKGVAFPTCISVNNCVCHNSPTASEELTPQVLSMGDVCKIDLAVHIDGYVATVAHTYILTETGALLTAHRDSKLVQAAQAILNVAIRKFRPGTSVYEITKVIEDAAAELNVNLLDGVLSHSMKRWIIDGIKCVPQKNVPEHQVPNFEIEPATVWTLDIAVTSGKGKAKEREARTNIFKLALEAAYQPKLDAARQVIQTVENNFMTFPFAVRALDAKKARLGLSELHKHNLVHPYPVLFERDGEVVAQLKVTLFVTNSKIERITGLPIQEGGDALPPFTSAELLETAKLPMAFVKKEKKTKQ